MRQHSAENQVDAPTYLLEIWYALARTVSAAAV